MVAIRVRADQDLCCGSGNCVLAAPEVFDQREEDGVVMIIDAAPSCELLNRVLKAEAGCPTGAISVSSPSPSQAEGDGG